MALNVLWNNRERTRLFPAKGKPLLTPNRRPRGFALRGSFSRLLFALGLLDPRIAVSYAARVEFMSIAPSSSTTTDTSQASSPPPRAEAKAGDLQLSPAMRQYQQFKQQY